MDFRILIDGKEIDYFDSRDFPLKLFRRSIDYKDPTQRLGEVSYTLKLPLNKNNKLAFGSLQMPEQVNKFRSLKPYTCEVYYKDINIATGRFILTAVKNYEIEGYIAAHVADFAKDLRGKNLKDLNLPEQVFEGWITINESLDAQAPEAQNISSVYTHNSQVICFPYVQYQNAFIPNRWTKGAFIDTTDYTELYGTTINLPAGKEIFGSDTYFLDYNSQSFFSFQDQPPSVYITEILKQICRDANWTAAGQFLEEERTKRLVMPYTGDKPYQYNWSFLARLLSSQQALQRLVFVYIFNYNIITGNTIWTILDEVREVSYRHNIRTEFYAVPQPPDTAFELWQTFFNILDFSLEELNYSFSLINENQNPDYQLHKTFYVAPVTAEYQFTIAYQINGNVEQINLDTVPSTTQTAIGLSKFDLSANSYEYIDGEFTLRQDSFGNNYENVIISQVVPPGNSGEVIISGWVRLEKGEAVCAWLGKTAIFGEYIPILEGTFQGTPLPGNPDLYATQVLLDSFQVTINVRDLSEKREQDKFGSLLKPAQNLPSLPQVEFIKSLIGLFNLYVEIDSISRTVYFESRDRFFAPVSTVYDLTENCNLKEATIRPPDIARFVNFKWKADGSDYLTNLRGNERYNFLYDTNIGFAQGTVNLESGIFHSTEIRAANFVVNQLSAPAVVDDFINPIFQSVFPINVPFLGDEAAFDALQNDPPEVNYSRQARLLIVDGATIFPTGDNRIYFVRVFDATEPIGSRDKLVRCKAHVQLNFANPTSQLFQLGVITFNDLDNNAGLFRQFYQRMYEGISKGYECEISAQINANDYDNMRINRPIKIDGNLYYLKEIKGFNPITLSPTNLILIKYY